MIDRKHVEQILKINGLGPTAKDEEIRSVLISAKWRVDDVDTALTVLREKPKTGVTRVDTVHNVFQSDKRLSPEAIESLLGIKLDITSEELKSLEKSRKSISFLQVMAIIFYATLLAFGSILTVMYVQGVGIFHPSL